MLNYISLQREKRDCSLCTEQAVQSQKNGSQSHFSYKEIATFPSLARTEIKYIIE